MSLPLHSELTGEHLHNPKAHATSHESGGSDTIDLSKISFSSELMVATNYYDAIIEAYSSGGGGSSVWGSITGTITNQTDLVNLFATKESVLTFSTGLTRTGNTITVDDSEIDHDSLSNTHNLTTDIDHNQLNNYASNRHFLQTDIAYLSTALATGLVKVTTGTGALSIVTDNSANWNTAYGWGNHASAGYLTTISGLNISLLNNDSNYLTSISGLNISLLTNDSGYLTSISGLNISLLTNDSGYITGISGLNISDLTNDSGYIIGLAWSEIGGDQSDINISGFTNDSSFITAGDIDWATNVPLNETDPVFSAWDKDYADLTNKPTIPDELSDLADDSTHRLVTDTEKSTWNGKQDALTADVDYLTPETASSTYFPIWDYDYTDLINKPTIPAGLSGLSDIDLTDIANGKILKYNSTSEKWECEDETAGGASQLSDLTDVGVTTPTNRNVLVADGDSWESRALTEADISDFGSYLTSISGLNISDLNNDSGFISDLSAFDLDDLADGSTYGRATLVQISNWNLAYSWGNHADAGYLTNITEESIGDLSDVTIAEGKTLNITDDATLSGSNTGDQSAGDFNHDDLNGYVANEHIDWTDATDTLLITKDNIGTSVTAGTILQNTDTGEVQISPSLVFKGNAYSGGNFPIQWWFNTANTYASGKDFEIRCRIPSLSYDALIANFTYDGTLGITKNIENNGYINVGSNLGIGTSTFGTDADKVICIANGTAPSTSPADMVQVYAEDAADETISLLLHLDGTDGATSTTDSSSYGHTVTFAGNAQLDTDYYKFGSSSLLLDGNADYITIADNDVLDLPGDFTIDFWARLNVIQGTGTSVIVRNTFLAKDRYGSGSYWNLSYGANGSSGDYINFWWNGSKVVGSTSGVLSAGTWYHIAITRSGTTTRLFLNGTCLDTNTSDSNSYTGTATLYVGYDVGNHSSTRDFNGWMDEIRIVKGRAVWTKNFTPPTAAYTTAGSELKVRDELGNITTLSPHNFKLFSPDNSYEFPWSYYSRNDYIGKEINVDMYGAIKALEELTGKQFLYINDIEKRDWNTDQQNEIDKLKKNKDKLIVKKMQEMIEISEDEALNKFGQLNSGCYRTIDGYYRKYTEDEATSIIENKISKLRIKEMPKWLSNIVNKKSKTKEI